VSTHSQDPAAAVKDITTAGTAVLDEHCKLQKPLRQLGEDSLKNETIISAALAIRRSRRLTGYTEYNLYQRVNYDRAKHQPYNRLQPQWKIIHKRLLRYRRHDPLSRARIKCLSSELLREKERNG
jgi:hypothetical protein